MPDADVAATPTDSPKTPKKRLKTAVETKRVKSLTINKDNIMDLLAASGVAADAATQTSFVVGEGSILVEWSE